MSADKPSNPPGNDSPAASLIIGVMAGAGSPSLKTLLRALPEQLGAALLVVQQPGSGKRLTGKSVGELCSFTVNEVDGEFEPASECIYLLPDDTKEDQAEQLLLNLSQRVGQCSIAVLLANHKLKSGKGLEALKTAGGLVLMEEPEAAADTPRFGELADHTLSIQELADCLVDLARELGPPQPVARSAQGLHGKELETVINTLHANSGYDFRQYKKPTLARRIQRRMGLRNIPDISAYIRLLEQDPEESLQLFSDLLIGVTRFFRDREAFEELRTKVLQPLIASRKDSGPIRIWMPGCSTGKEAYSLSILLHEEFARQGLTFNVQIFATDIDEGAVAVARAGRYHADIAKEIPDDYLHTYFIREDNGFRVRKTLRESVTFAIQNVITDPPFSKLDLICCRNLLIYLQTAMQNQLMELFHFSLNDDGYLFLGSSESTSRHEALYEPISKQYRIYRKKPLARPHSAEHRSYSFSKNSLHRSAGASPMDVYGSFFSAAEATRSTLLSHLAPAAVLINGRYEILYFHGATSQYLYHQEGEPTNDLCMVAASGLKTKIRAAVQQARKHGGIGVARARHVRKMDDSRVAVTVSALPVRKSRGGETLFVVTFSDETESEQQIDAPADEKNSNLYSQLEYELLVTRQDLQSTIEQLESSNEELKASNEEIMSMNEELQSSNEELETSREELQSLNEELNTVNNQLEEKIQELEALNNDLANLLSSTDIATIFLDTQLRIRRFTPATSKIVRLISSDIGRPLADLALNFRDRNLIDDCHQVLQTLKGHETQVSDERGRVYLRRITLYRTNSDQVGGVVITFTDITDINTVISKLATRERQQAVVARFGQEALTEENLDVLFDHTVKWTTEAIGVEFCKLLELHGDNLILRAGIGWREGLIGLAFQSAERSSQGGYTLASGKPVIVEDMATETRFPAPSLLTEHNVRSGMSVIIGPHDQPWGVLGVHSRSPRRFSREDMNFIQAMANGLWSSIQRHQSMYEVTTKALQLEMAMHLGQMGSWTWDLESDTAIWDKATAEIFGLPRIRKPSSIDVLFERIHPDDLDIVHGDMARLISEHQGFRREYRIIHGESGQLRWVAGYGGIRQDGEHRSIIYGLGYDITERKHYEVALKDREEWLRLALSASELTSFWIDIEADELSLYNPSLGRYLEAEPYSIQEYLSSVHVDDREQLENVWRTSMKQKSSFVIEYRVNRKGVTRWFRNWGNYVALHGRRRLAGITMDITHEKENEARLRTAKQAADASNEAKSAFLANMSHEIRTPLTAILGYADLLHMERDKLGMAENYLHKIKANGQNLLEIIDDVLDLSKVEADRIEVRRERFAIKTLLGELLSLTHLRAKEKELEFTIDIPEPVPAFITSDLGRVKQVLSNLISNAIKFTPQGSVRLVVTVDESTGRSDTTMQFQVVDTGIGIDESMLEKIFDPFEQADSSIAKLYGGTGLGLTISRRITQLLGGQLQVDSQPGKGSVFTLSLPVGSTEDEDYIQFDVCEILNQKYLPPAISSHELRGAHVLVVDDVDDVLALIQQMLKMAGASVSTARNGKEALEQVEVFESEGPAVDIILMDTMMPVVDGYTAVRSLRQQGFSKPIVALTAAAMTNDRERCLRAGCNDYLSKPVTAEQLISVLKAQLSAASSADNNRVLIVEDNQDAGEAVQALLEMLGYDCRLATNAKTALEIVEVFKPSTMLLDLDLPDMDGRELAGIMRQRYAATLIALSGHDLQAQEEELEAAGFDFYLQKPVDLARLSSYFPELLESAES